MMLDKPGHLIASDGEESSMMGSLMAKDGLLPEITWRQLEATIIINVYSHYHDETDEQ